jgi:hypothetical protein
MAYLIDGQGDLWVPSGEYAPDGDILWQLESLQSAMRPGHRSMWVPITATTIATRYGAATVYGVGPTGTVGNAQSHSGG